MQRLQVRLPGSNGNRVLISRITTPNTLHAEYTKPGKKTYKEETPKEERKNERQQKKQGQKVARKKRKDSRKRIKRIEKNQKDD